MGAPTVMPVVKPASVTVACALEHIEAQGVSITPAVVGAMNALFDAPRDDDDRGLERSLILSSELAHRAVNIVCAISPQTVMFGPVMLVAMHDACVEMIEKLGVQL